MAKGQINKPEWCKEIPDESVKYVCDICKTTHCDRMYYQLGIYKHCERIIRAFVPSAADKPVSQISEQDLKKIKYLLRRGVSSKRTTPVCRVCSTKRKSFKEMSDPVNLICIDCYNTYVKTMLPKGRWALNRITLLDTEFNHLRDAYIHDKYDEEDKKKLEWFLTEYGGKLPAQEHMDSLVGKQQAQRIRLMYNKRKREEHAANVTHSAEKRKFKLFFPKVNKDDSELTIKAKTLLKKVLSNPYQILPSMKKLLEITGETREVITELLRVDKKRRQLQFKSMTYEERMHYIEIRHPNRVEGYKKTH